MRLEPGQSEQLDHAFHRRRPAVERVAEDEALVADMADAARSLVFDRHPTDRPDQPLGRDRPPQHTVRVHRLQAVRAERLRLAQRVPPRNAVDHGHHGRVRSHQAGQRVEHAAQGMGLHAHEDDVLRPGRQGVVGHPDRHPGDVAQRRDHGDALDSDGFRGSGARDQRHLGRGRGQAGGEQAADGPRPDDGDLPHAAAPRPAPSKPELPCRFRRASGISRPVPGTVFGRVRV